MVFQSSASLELSDARFKIRAFASYLVQVMFFCLCLRIITRDENYLDHVFILRIEVLQSWRKGAAERTPLAGKVESH